MMKVEELVTLEKEYTFSNGATLQLIAEPCQVCEGRGEEPEVSQFMVEYEGQQLYVCRAHGQELVDADADKKEKGGIFSEVFGGE